MVRLTAKEVKLKSEGKQVANLLIAKYGPNGINEAAKRMGIEPTSLNRYLKSFRLSSNSTNSTLMLKELLGEEFKVKSIEDQILETIEFIDKNLEQHIGNSDLSDMFDIFTEKTIDEVIRAKCRILKATISGQSNTEVITLIGEITGGSEAQNNNELKAFCFRTLASLYYDKGDNAHCDEYAKKALRYETDKNEMARLYHQLGLNGWVTGDFEQALINLKKSLDLYKYNPEGQLKIINVIGLVEYKARDLDSSRKTFRKLLKYANEYENKEFELIAYNNLFDVWSDNQKLARHFCSKAYEMAKECGYPKSVDIAKLNVIKYQAQYDHDENKFKDLLKELYASEHLDTTSLKIYTENIFREIKKAQNYTLYVNLAINSIIELIKQSTDSIEISKYEGVLGSLIKYIMVGDENEEKGVSIRVSIVDGNGSTAQSDICE